MGGRRVQSLYRMIGEDGWIPLFDGELNVRATGGKWTAAQVQVELRLIPETKVVARVFGPAGVSAYFSDSEELRLEVSNRTDLKPPSDSWRATGEDQFHEFRPSRIRLGDLAAAETFLFHVSGALDVWADLVAVESGTQRQLGFDLPGWQLLLAPADPTPDSGDFAAAVLAEPTGDSVVEEDLERLHRWLFILLSFIAGREVGIGPVCGLNCGGSVVWTEWGAPRMGSGTPGIKWCPRLLVANAIPQLAAGFSALAEDPELEVIVDRAIGYALAANGEEVVDVRIPNVCSGLEILAWALLQREEWLLDEGVRRLKPASIVRLFLKWAGIPPTVPPTLTHLARRLKAVNRSASEGPEVLFEIRNAMVHPPKRLAAVEWPQGEELVDAWLLGAWYLELGLLRVLGYEGQFWSRVKSSRYAADVELVPWVVTDQDAQGAD